MSGVYNKKDALHQKAKKEGYRSRAAYKLIELDKKYSLFKKNTSVVDLGAAPGGWLQVALKKVGSEGKVIGIDLEQIESIAGLNQPLLIQGDFLEDSIRGEILDSVRGGVDLVLSDMSPKLSGIKLRDLARSAELVESAFLFAESVLKPGGILVTKIFPGAEADEIFSRFRTSFRSIKREKLKSTRKTSNEYYFVAKGFVKE